MTNPSFYPMDLCVVLQQLWRNAGHDASALPGNEDLFRLIDTAYQASLLREEDSPVQCRVIVTSPDAPELKSMESVDGPYVVPFMDQSEFSAHQVRKIASAVGYHRSMIAVQVDSDEGSAIRIWGMIVTGAGWINQTETTVHDAISLPSKLIIHILGPGHLVFSAGLNRVMETFGGKVLMDGFDPFRSKWLPRHFEPFRAALLEKLPARLASSNGVRLCDSFVRDVAQSVVRRMLSLVRARGHGGMLIYLNDAEDSRLDNWLRMRIRIKHTDTTDRFEQLMLRLMERTLEVGAANGIAEVRWKDFLRMHDASLGKFNDSLVEFSHFLADLMNVDGCLVLSRDFRLIGFGGEILGDSHVQTIERAIDLEAENSVTEQADSSGTRHRSAYRLVSFVQDAIVVLVSQDGAVRFVAHRGGRLVYWPYLP